ncbi:MAG TPA: hypothetical protein VFV01_48015 [Spirillospora sp.]|nr:hypothetical protein [Spirillospora sp.]
MSGQLWRTLPPDGACVTYHDPDACRAAAQLVADATGAWVGVEEWSAEHPQDELNSGWALIEQVRPAPGRGLGEPA